MNKERLFEIRFDKRTGDREMKECKYQKTLGWSKDKYDTELLNALAVSIGMKLNIMFRSEKAKREALRLLTEEIERILD